MQRGFQKQVERQDTVTHNQSLTLVRNLFRTAISSVCYLRGLFPENCFSDRSVVGLNIKSLTTSNKQVAKIVEWLEDGVFDALEKRYLREVIFGVTTDPNNPKSLVESYRFDVRYPENGKYGKLIEDITAPYSNNNNNNDNTIVATNNTNTNSTTTTFRMSVNDDSDKPVTRANVKEATVTLLRRLMSMTQMLPELPERRYIYMGLRYTEDTPSDYEPPHFRPTNIDPGSGSTMEIGRVRTGFHTLNLSLSLRNELGTMEYDMYEDTFKTHVSEVINEAVEERTPSPKRYTHKIKKNQTMINLPESKRSNGTSEREVNMTREIEDDLENEENQLSKMLTQTDRIIEELKRHSLTILQLSRVTGIPQLELKEVINILIENKTIRFYRSRLYIV